MLLILVIVGEGVAGNYFYNLAINPKASKTLVLGTSTEESVDKFSWLLNESNYKDSYVTSNDDLKLHGYEIENANKSDVWVITVHGYMGRGYKMSNYAESFYDMGYNVLVPDLRGHGDSEGNYIGMGWNDRQDIIKWINYIIEQHKDAKIILHGVSMGAATVMMTSGEDLPENVKAIVEDCGYTSAWDEFYYQLDNLFSKLPKNPILFASDLVTKLKAGYGFKEASAIKQVEKSETPMLFIHGDEDTFVPYYMLDEVYEAANVEKEKLVVEGAEHANAASTNPELYWSTISNFINKYINE